MKSKKLRSKKKKNSLKKGGDSTLNLSRKNVESLPTHEPRQSSRFEKSVSIARNIGIIFNTLYKIRLYLREQGLMNNTSSYKNNESSSYLFFVFSKNSLGRFL